MIEVTVGIKALNEEKNICAAIESSLAAVAKVGGEVVLADSCSTDRTVELASKYPVRVVQFADPREPRQPLRRADDAGGAGPGSGVGEHGDSAGGRSGGPAGR